MDGILNTQRALSLAVEIALNSLKEVDIRTRCINLGLPLPGAKGSVELQAFGKAMVFSPQSGKTIYPDSGSIVKPVEQILVLHYLLHDGPVAEVHNLISFRDLPGGQFYLGPFQARTMIPLVKHFENNIQLLEKNLDRFKWMPINTGDLGASIHVIGNISMTLVYRLGDEEFPPSANICFDRIVSRVFSAEDIVRIAEVICRGLF